MRRGHSATGRLRRERPERQAAGSIDEQDRVGAMRSPSRAHDRHESVQGLEPRKRCRPRTSPSATDRSRRWRAPARARRRAGRPTSRRRCSSRPRSATASRSGRPAPASQRGPGRSPLDESVADADQDPVVGDGPLDDQLGRCERHSRARLGHARSPARSGLVTSTPSTSRWSTVIPIDGSRVASPANVVSRSIVRRACSMSVGAMIAPPHGCSPSKPTAVATSPIQSRPAPRGSRRGRPRPCRAARRHRASCRRLPQCADEACSSDSADVAALGVVQGIARHLVGEPAVGVGHRERAARRVAHDRHADPVALDGQRHRSRAAAGPPSGRAWRPRRETPPAEPSKALASASVKS